MSKLYTRYLELKRKDPNKMYLMKSGLFYIFIDEDAVEMSNLTKLKCIPLTGNIMKCGFPENSKEKYLRRLKENGKIVEIVELEAKRVVEENKLKKIEGLTNLTELDLNSITPIEALELLHKIQRELLENQNNC